MNGNQFVQSYAPTFYKQQGLGEKSFLYNLLGQVVGFVGCFIGLILLDITGRRPLFIYGSGVVMGLLFLAAGLGLNTNRDTNRANTIVACFILLKAFSRISATNCAFLTGAEIGGLRFRKKIMALGTSSDVLAAFLVTFVTPYILPALGVNIGEYSGFYRISGWDPYSRVSAWIFGGVAGFGSIWGFFFFPELKGRSLEEVDEVFDSKTPAWRTKSYISHGKARAVNELENHITPDSESIYGKEGGGEYRHAEKA
jgi:SP family sugar:H+ symporter-like MFS transporter